MRDAFIFSGKREEKERGRKGERERRKKEKFVMILLLGFTRWSTICTPYSVSCSLVSKS
jgi:hypothetical protein